MDFVSYIRDQISNLNSTRYVNYLWNELEEIPQETGTHSIDDFNNHFPLMLDQFWEMAVEKVEDPSTCTFDEMDDDLRKYLLAIIYHCLTIETNSQSVLLCPSRVYLQLITARFDDFFNSKLYHNILLNLQKYLELHQSEAKTNILIRKLRVFMCSAKLKTSDLQISLSTLVQIIFIRSNEVYSNFEIESESASPAYEALLGLKNMLRNETVPHRKFIVISYYFNGLRQYSGGVLSSSTLSIIQTNFRNLLKSSDAKLAQDDYEAFTSAFVHVWQHRDFFYYNEAVNIMNTLPKKQYMNLLDILNKLILSKNCHQHLFALSLAIMHKPSKLYNEEKIVVNNLILLQNILLNCLNESPEISSAAIDSFAAVLTSPHFENRIIKEPILNLLSGSDVKVELQLPTILRAFKSLVRKKWSGSKNKQIFAIIVSIMEISACDYPDLYREILGELCEEANSFDLKSFLPLIGRTYIKLYRENRRESSFQLLKILMRAALHQMATSADFVKYLYSSMIANNSQNDCFIDPIISDEFNYEEFFQKCENIGLIHMQHIENLTKNLSIARKSNLKLLCAIIHRSKFKKFAVINDHIQENINNPENLNYLFFIYSNLLKDKNNLKDNSEANRQLFDFLVINLKSQLFGTDCIGNAFGLVKQLETILNERKVLLGFKTDYDQSLKNAIMTNTEFVPLFYYSQLVVFERVLPEHETTQLLLIYLNQCEDELFRNEANFSYDFWTAALFLYMNMAVIRPTWVDKAQNYLLQVQTCSNTKIKLAAINMSFDLCNLVTHNFEELIKYMFRQLLFGDYIYKKTSLTKLDNLIREDYLKLDMVQFIIFVSMIEDRECGDFFMQLLNQNFLQQKCSVITKHLVPFVVHSNLYRKHNLYQILDEDYELIKIVALKMGRKHRVYRLLFSQLDIRARFNVLALVSSTILQLHLKKALEIDEHLKNVLNDSIYLFKLVATIQSDVDEDASEEYFKKVLTIIQKKLLNRNQEIHAIKPKFNDIHKQIETATEVLLRMFHFLTDIDMKIHCFDAIIFWTDYFLDELNFMIHIDKRKKLEEFYKNLDKFYMQNVTNIKNGLNRAANRNCENFPQHFPTTSHGTFSINTQFAPSFRE